MKILKNKILPFAFLVLVNVLSAISQTLNVSAPGKGSQPNIIFIFADDHAAHAISSYGSRVNETPNIDRLAQEGMRFTRCFAANALCAPSRANLITGKHSAANGFRRNEDRFNAQTTFPQLLQRSGYRTALFGKWHLNAEPQGFDDYAILPGQGSYYNFKLLGNFTGNGLRKDSNDVYEGYVTDELTTLSINWLKQQRGKEPFCLMLHHKAPHTPHIYPEKYNSLFTEDLPLPETFNDDFSRKNSHLINRPCGYSKLDSIIPAHILAKAPAGLSPVEFKHWAYQSFFKGYLRLVAALDDNIGRLLDYLDESGLAENTLIIYTSDNGFFLGDHGLFNKMWMYEESMRLPFLVRYPGEIQPGTVNDELISILDIAPTLLDYADATVPGDLHGRSLRPLFNGQRTADWRTALYYHYYGQYDVPAHNGIRTKDHKLIHFYTAEDAPQWELYDLQRDPQELRNLIDHKDYQRDYRGLKKTLVSEMNKFNEKVD